MRNDNGELNNIKLKENKNEVFVDVSLLSQSFVFKTGENNKERERYNFQKEENEKKNLDDIKNILLNINENDLSKESTELNSNISLNEKSK